MLDSRNVIDRYKGVDQATIIADLDMHGSALEIAIENLERDFNMGTIVRSANAFGVRKVHVIGRRQWNKRGAMMTDTYMHVYYYSSVDEFLEVATDYTLIAVDNVPGAASLSNTSLPDNSILIFGSEKHGLSEKVLRTASQTVMIEQFGSTRSINVGVAAGIIMYEWLRQNRLS